MSAPILNARSTFESLDLETSLQRWLDGPFRDQPAIVSWSGSISYRRMASDAMRFGHRLQKRIASLENPRVALLLDSTTASVVALWGALLATENCP
jgi:acyl-CoA synthetase (AMP-forming)/AMP-acid ligase II